MPKSVWRTALLGIASLLVVFVLPYQVRAFTLEATETIDMGVELDIDTVIAITVNDESIDIDMTPTMDGTFAYKDTSVSVSTNNETGYTLNMSAIASETALTFEANKILTLANDAEVTAGNKDNFAKNRWGYTLDNQLTNTPSNTVFSAVPGVDNPVKINSSEAPINHDMTPLAFGVHINTDLLAGMYRNTVIFTAITNYVPEATFSGISFMQDMTPTICAMETTPNKDAVETTRISKPGNDNYVPEAVLVDERDSKEYIVRKLADGNCWMSQSLRLGEHIAKHLTSEDSDISDGRIFELPSAQSTPGTRWATSVTSAANANTAHVYDTGKEEYGHYYNWYTATAGTGEYATVSAAASDSICPKGWQLPNNTGSKSYTNLITDTYGIANSSAGSTKLRSAPLSFVMEGYYDRAGTVNSQESYGGLWTNMAYSSGAYAYRAYYTSSVVNPNYYDSYKVNGVGMRCVAR